MSDNYEYKIITCADQTAVKDSEEKIKKVPPSTSSSVCRSFCKFFLLLTVASIIVTVVFAGALFYCGRHVTNIIGENVVPKITVNQPLDLPVVHLPESELNYLIDRLDDFYDAIRKGKVPPHDLELTEQEVNGLICRNDEICGNVYATISKDMVSADFSFPAEDVPGGQGRFFVGNNYLVATPRTTDHELQYFVQYVIAAHGLDVWEDDFPLVNMTFDVDLRHDMDVRIKSSEIIGWRATDVFVHRFFDGKNWAENMCSHAEKSLKLIKGVTIGDGKIVVHVNRKDPELE